MQKWLCCSPFKALKVSPVLRKLQRHKVQSPHPGILPRWEFIYTYIPAPTTKKKKKQTQPQIISATKPFCSATDHVPSSRSGLPLYLHTLLTKHPGRFSEHTGLCVWIHTLNRKLLKNKDNVLFIFVILASSLSPGRYSVKCLTNEWMNCPKPSNKYLARPKQTPYLPTSYWVIFRWDNTAFAHMWMTALKRLVVQPLYPEWTCHYFRPCIKTNKQRQ